MFCDLNIFFFNLGLISLSHGFDGIENRLVGAFCQLQLYLYIACTSATVGCQVNPGIMNAMVFTNTLKLFPLALLP